MTRVVLDTNIIVSALLVPEGTQASVLLLALQGPVALCISSPVIAEYEEVLHRPRLKLQPRQIQNALVAIRKVARLVSPTQTLSISTHESDNRFLECAEAARADYLVTGNTRHFPQSHKTTKIVTGRQFLDALTGP
ncbi:MAG: putative toxin-antitoxin system toxin component, PIN family [Acidobacteria bacterium]|nr:putative toxin-antitoxin system toxin component, PIN family [Acidobacteriota bacterium]MBI3472038.1 putative toxin-antitoxin system toxin component, PIN family [Candidatus Solibacter usitatus]